MALLRRRVIEPIWARRCGTPLLSTWRNLEASQYLPEPALRDRQWRLLREMLEYAYAHNRFYRRRLDACGVHPASIRSLEDFRRIPQLTKQEVREQGEAILSDGYEPSRLMIAKTGGSTGLSLRLWAPEAVSEMRNACGRRCRRWAGWEVGEPVAAVWGNPHRPATRRGRLREWLLSPYIYLDTMSVSREAVLRFAAEWRAIQPTLLFGHAHSIYVLADMVEAMALRDIQPRAIISSSMMLLPHERRRIEAVFGVQVFDMYGCEEVGLIASECERHEGLHLNMEQLLVELVRDDGTTASPGEHGHILVTDLLNQAMPLIRYRMEDMADATDRPCSCGRGLPLIGRVSGRLADFLVRRDGTRTAGVSLIENSLTRIPGILQMQIVQEALDRIRLRVVPDSAFDADCRAELETYFRNTFPGAQIEVEQVSRITPEANGKFRFSICRVA